MLRRFHALKCAKQISRDVRIRPEAYDDPDFTEATIERIWQEVQSDPNIRDKIEEFNRRIHDFPN